MKITALIENRKSDNHSDLEVEHGLSLHIEYSSHNILFDTGCSEAFARNAEKLGVNLKLVDMAILSHHHYDHGGGFNFFLEHNDKSKVYLGKRPHGDALFKDLGGMMEKYIGLDKTLFDKYTDRFLFINGLAEISHDIFVLTDICNKYPRPKGNSKLMVKTDSGLEPDRFEHEIIVVIKENGKLIVLTGCAHSGILNMVETVVRNFPNTPIKAVIGGFHLPGIPVEALLPETPEEIAAVASQMMKYPIEKVYTGHCTGMIAYEMLKKVMGHKLEYISTGTSIEL